MSSRNIASCWPCHSRKVNCGREKPNCQRCLARGKECTWEKGLKRARTVSTASSAAASPPKRSNRSTRSQSLSNLPSEKEGSTFEHEAPQSTPPKVTSRTTDEPVVVVVSFTKPTFQSTSQPPCTAQQLEPEPSISLLPPPRPPAGYPAPPPLAPTVWHDGWELQSETEDPRAVVTASSAFGYCERLLRLPELSNGGSTVDLPYTSLLSASDDSGNNLAELPHDLLGLIDFFNGSVNLRYPLFVPATLRSLAESSLVNEFSSEDRALLMVVSANAALASPDDQRAASFALAAISLISFSPPASPSILRAHLLLCIYYQDAHEPLKAWMSLAAAVAVAKILGIPSTPGPLTHHLQILCPMHQFLAGRMSIGPPCHESDLEHPPLTASTSTQVASYGFLTLLKRTVDLSEDRSTVAEQWREWAPLLPSDRPAEVRKGNAIGAAVHYEYIALARLVLLTKAQPFAESIGADDGAAALKDAEELLIAVGRLQSARSGFIGGLVSFAGLVGLLVCAISTLRTGSQSSKLSLVRASIIFNSPSLSNDPLGTRGRALLKSLKVKLQYLKPTRSALPGFAEPYESVDTSLEWQSFIQMPSWERFDSVVRSKSVSKGWREWLEQV